ncbi:MAG: sensor domain-containing diguanylate cyclase [Candidatus Firestonebacteria bacterium]
MKLEEVLNIILGNLTNELGYDRVVIYALETSLGGKQDYLKAMAAYKIDLSKIQDYTLKLDKSIDIVPRAAIEKKSYIVSNAKDDHRCSQEFVELLNLKQYIVLPLIAKDITVGALLADNSINYKSIDEKDLPPLMLFANQAAIAIENAKLYEQIEQLAITDGLTKLHNHRYFQENLRKELSRFDRYDGQQKGLLSILMMDVDWFKHYNDTNGHIAGDTVLIEIGQILKNFTRKVDLVARYGGEEFIMVLPNTTKPGAMLLAERIRKTIEEHPFEFGHSQPLKKVTVTIGVSTYRDDAMTQEELIACADKGLYIGKEAGRNRVCYVNQPADSDQ